MGEVCCLLVDRNNNSLSRYYSFYSKYLFWSSLSLTFWSPSRRREEFFPDHGFHGVAGCHHLPRPLRTQWHQWCFEGLSYASCSNRAVHDCKIPASGLLSYTEIMRLWTRQATTTIACSSPSRWCSCVVWLWLIPIVKLGLGFAWSFRYDIMDDFMMNDMMKKICRFF